MEGEDEVLEVIAEHWEELDRKREDTEAEMGDVGGHKLVVCEDILERGSGDNEMLEERKSSWS